MSEIPLIYKDKCLIRRKVYHISDSSTFFVTKKLEFIEINKNQEIVNYIKLQNSDETFNDVDIPDKIQLKTYERLDSSLILLFQLRDKVFVIKRKRFEIKLIKVFHEVDSFKIKGQIKNNENVVVLKMKDGSSEQTSFNDEEFDKETRENNVELIKSIDSNIKYQKTCMIKTLKNITLKQQLKIYLMIGKQKFLPRFMRLHVSSLIFMCYVVQLIKKVHVSVNPTCDIKDPNDVSPLVRFGCIFSRVCNDKLVIGIPVFNASSLER
ncbi:unnamed protein product [Chironomus riparius]|uniref:Uncharacterized protein n=1 Tax=Chironomus riparius TaxID=315576 RepID=A0A9N9RQ74_9DIPT|nr:unnamed protein product [Chironomus riparius]